MNKAIPDKKERCATAIRLMQRKIDECNSYIDSIAKAHFPDFHFMSHQVSTFWDCEESPIGMCIFEKLGFDSCNHVVLGDCVFCHQPSERK